MLLVPINLVIFLLFEYLIDPYQRTRNYSSTKSQRLEIACVQCEKKRKFIIFGKSGVETNGSVFNASLPKCINQLQNFVYKTQDIQPKENTKQGSSLITWITKYVYRYVNNNDSSKSCIECQQRVIRYWQDLHHTESSYAEYIHSHIFFIHSKRPQCRNPDCDSKRLKCVPYSKIGAGRFKIVRNFVNFSSDGTEATLAIKGESRKNDQITGSNRTLNSLKSSNDIRLYKLFGYFSSKGKSIIFLPFRHLICSRDMKQENQGCCSDKDKFSSHLALSNELVNTYTATSYEGKPGINLTSFYEDTLQKSFLEQTPSSMQDELVMSDLSSKEVLASVHETGISSTTASSEKKSEFEVTSFSQDTLEESTVEHTLSLIQDTILESDASSKEVLASVHETGISSTTASSEKKSEFEVTSFSQDTLEESTVELASSLSQDTILESDASSKEVLASVHEIGIFSTTTSSERKSEFEVTFKQDALEESTVEHTSSLIQDTILESDASSKEVLASVHETGISSTTTSSEKKSEFEGTSFSEDSLEESTVEHAPSLIQVTILESDASSKEVLASVHESGISSTTASSEKKSEFEVTSFSQNTLEESTVEHTPSLIQDTILESDASSKEVLASVHRTGISSNTASDGRPGIEGTLFNQNTSKESTVDQTPPPMVDAVLKSYFRKGDILASNSHSRMYTAVEEFSRAKTSSIYTYMHEAHSRSNTIEETSKDNKAVVQGHGHVIISPTAKKLANTLLWSSYSNYVEIIADNPTNSLKIETWQQATPLLRTVEVTQLKSTLLSELSSKDLEVSLQKSSGIVRTSTGVHEQVEVLETERYGDSVDDSFEEGTESIKASMMHKNFSPLMEFNSLLLKSKNPPAVLKSKSMLDKRFELSPSYKMQSAALTEIDDNNKLPLIATKYSRQLSSTVLEKPLSKVEMKQDSLNPAKEISVQKSQSGNSVSERTMAMHKISLSRIDSEFSSNMFLLPSTQVKFASQSLLHDVIAKQSDIDFSMTHSQTQYLPKNSYIYAQKKKTKDQQFVDADASSKFLESKKRNKQWKKEDLEGKIVAEKLYGNIKISTDENTLLKSSEIHEKEITKASENIEYDIIGTRRTEIDSDKSETMKVGYSDAGTSETILLNQIDSHLKRNTTISESEIQLTTSITTIAMSGDPTFEKENQKLPHLAQKTDEFGWDSSKLYAVEHKNFDDTFGFEDSYNGSLVAPIVNLKEIEEGKIFILSPDFIILLTLLILVCYKLLRRSLQRYSPSKGGSKSNNKGKPQIETVTTKFDIFMAPTGEIKFELKQELKIT